MRTYAPVAWLILCAGIRMASGQQPDAWGADPILTPNAVEQVGRLEDQFGADPADVFGRPPAGADDASPEEFAYQYPLDQDDYRPPPPQPPRTWVPPVLRPEDRPAAPTGDWLRLKTTKAALSHLGSSGNLGITTFQVRPTVEFPGAPGVFVTPNFGWHFLGGPSSTDLPPRFHDFSVDFSVYRPVRDWLVQVSLMPGIFTDGDNTGSDALRIQGRLMGFYTMNPGRQLVLGIVYLDREDVPVLPTFGLVLEPRQDLKYELLFPKPRLSWRQSAQGNWEQWVYTTGELGGGSWAVRRSGGLDDIATYRDLRLVLGLERRHASSRSWYVEGGYVFGRELEFDSNIGNVSFAETAFLRVGGAF